MNDWLELHGQHRELRGTGGSSPQEIRRVLQLLIERKHAHATLMNRFTNKKNKGTNRREWYIAAPKDTGEEDKKYWSEPLLNLAPDIAEARLTILALTEESDMKLSKLTIMLSGRNSVAAPFVVAAHLDDCHMGSGACGHALFHCHVGSSLDAVPKVRVPLPALRPAATLEWALSIALPGWEPVPWNVVTAHFAPKKKD
jgi:hypothetical protein